MPIKEIDSGRYRISKGLKPGECKDIAENSSSKLVLLDEPMPESEITILENELFSVNPDIILSLYTSHPKEPSLSFLKNLPSLKHLWLFVSNAKHFETFESLTCLESLHISDYGIENFDFLRFLNPDIKELYLFQTISSKPNIRIIERFKSLERLYIEGHSKNIEIIQGFKNLKEVVLRSISYPNVDFLLNLKELWSVDIKLGGIRDFSALEKLPQLKYLELWQVRQLKDISFISNLLALESLFLQSLPNVATFPPITNLKNLRRIYLENMKGLTNLDSLKKAPSLNEFIFIEARNQSPEQLIPVLKNPSVKSLFCLFGSDKKTHEFEQLCKDNNKSFAMPDQFVFN